MVGMISSILTQKAKIPHLLSSIMTIGLFHGINQFVLGGPNISLSAQVNILEYFNIFDFLVQNPELFALSLIFVVVVTKYNFSDMLYGFVHKFNLGVFYD